MQFSKLSKILKASLSRNLIEKPEEAEVKKENCISMVQCKVMKQLELLEQRKFEDEDIQEDISFLMEKMNESVQVVITFHIWIWYCIFRTSPATMNMWQKSAAAALSGARCTEARSSGERMRPSWTTRITNFFEFLSHFWKAPRNHLFSVWLALILVRQQIFWDWNSDNLFLGEYVRHYQRGKHVLETLGGKTMVMALLSHDDPNVRWGLGKTRVQCQSCVVFSDMRLCWQFRS